MTDRAALAGVRVVLTRSAEQAGPLRDALARAGARVVLAPSLRIVDPDDGGASLRRAVARLGAYDWVVVTSSNGSRRLLAAAGGPLPRPPRVAAVGRATAAVLEAAGTQVDLVPERQVGEGLVEAFPSPPAPGGTVLLARAAVARDVVPEGLRRAGWDVEVVDAYRTVPAVLTQPQIAEVTAADAVVFTSPSTVTHLLGAVGRDRVPPHVVCIGPVTAEAAQEQGLQVAAVARTPGVAALVDAVTSAVRTGRPAP